MKITMSEAEYLRATADYEGVCLACGESADQVEPDAEEYECAVCGEPEVCGVEQALLLGKLTIKG